MKSLGIERTLGDRAGMATSCHQLGILEQEWGNPDAAETRFRRELRIVEDLGDHAGTRDGYNHLGMVALTRRDLDANVLDEAESWFRQALKIARAVADRRGISANFHQLGMVEQLWTGAGSGSVYSLRWSNAELRWFSVLASTRRAPEPPW